MFKKFREKINLYTIKKPRVVILTTIIALNILILIASSMAINFLMRDHVGNIGFWKTLYYTLGMILDAGMVENVVYDIGTASVVLVIICILTIIIGSITFTGAIIGYVTNYISNFIESANSDSISLQISNHVVILNWNSRASEIINDLLFLGRRETIIVLVNENAEDVRKEINERLYITLRDRKGVKNKLDIIVREGSTYSTKQLNEISLNDAKTVIILGDDNLRSTCKYETKDKLDLKGNTNTIKTLVQVAEITSQDNSADNQKIVVEVEDSWTASVVEKIISYKERLGKCNIIALPVNKILGQILSQFCIFPELNMVYSTLFSNDGAEFFCKDYNTVEEGGSESKTIASLLNSNPYIIPLSKMETKSGEKFFYMSLEEGDIDRKYKVTNDMKVSINKKYCLEKRNVIILGHNSKINEIMLGFEAFRHEWKNNDGSEILDIMVIDDKKSLEKQNYYKDYSYVNKIVEAEFFDDDIIKREITSFIDAHYSDTSILILSDDQVVEKDVDSYPLANLICVQEIIREKVLVNPDFDLGKIDVIVEILNPKNYDVVHSYNVDNIVISNRYISKMITQIGEKTELYEFYKDILTYDTGEGSFESKEIYIKPADSFLTSIPGKCKASELIRAIYENSPDDNKSLLLGIAGKDGSINLFEKDQRDYEVELKTKDKLILFSNH